jgi:hypothetical protein
VPYQRHGHWHGDTQVSGPVRPLFFPYSPPIGWTIFTLFPLIAGCPGACQRVPNQRHGHRYGDTQVPDPVRPLFFLLLASYWLDNIYPCSHWLQVALEHASVCLINATATGTEILKSLVLPGLGSFTILDANKEYFTLFLSQTI